jgi:hypothetical protein
MTRRLTLSALVIMLALPLVALAQEPVKEPPAGAVPVREMASRMFQLRNVVPTDMSGALRLLVSRRGDAGVMANDKTMTITIRDFPENLDVIAAAIKLLDQPKPPSAPLEFQISLLAATSADGDAGAEMPAPLKSVVEQLKRTLAFKHYRYITTVTQRGQDDGRTKGSGAIVDVLAGGAQPPRAARYQYELSQLRMVPNPSGAATFSLNFVFSIALPQDVAMGTDLTIREGEQVVVGTSSAGDGDKSIIVVLSVRRVGA